MQNAGRIMLKRIQNTENVCEIRSGAELRIAEASFPAPFLSGLEYSSPARGTWNIVHTGMLIPQAHEIFVCAAGCLRGVVLTAAEMNASERFSTVAVRERDLLEGDMEDLIVEGVTDVIEKLTRAGRRPPAILVYTSCVHHFSGCDIESAYAVLRARFPDIDFTDCYMNPIMRKSGLTPDQIMRSCLYSLLRPRPIDPKALAILGNDLPTDEDSELFSILRAAGWTVHEITSCRSYEDYQRMAEAALYVSYYPAAKAGGDALAARLGGRHMYLPFSYSCAEIAANLDALCQAVGAPQLDHAAKAEECRRALAETRALIGDTPIAIDYTAVPRPLGLARLLLDSGFRVTRVYADSFSGEEKADFDYLRQVCPDLLVTATVHAKMRFASERDEVCLAIGQKAAYFENTDHFVNVVEGGGMYGYEAVVKTCALMREAYLEPKPMRELVQIKGQGCGCCL